MGEYVYCTNGAKVPLILTPQYLGLDTHVETKQWSLAGTARDNTHSVPNMAVLALMSPRGRQQLRQQQQQRRRPDWDLELPPPPPPPEQQQQRRQRHTVKFNMSLSDRHQHHSQEKKQQQQCDRQQQQQQQALLQLYQVLSPSQVVRGRFFGSKLALKEEWVPLDLPYFAAPGGLGVSNNRITGMQEAGFQIGQEDLQGNYRLVTLKLCSRKNEGEGDVP